MSKSFYLTKRKDIWYVRFVNPITFDLSVAKSTGTKDKDEAERISMRWFINGNIPNDIRNTDNTKNLQVYSIKQSIKNIELKREDVEEIIQIFKDRGFIETAVYKGDANSVLFIDYLYDFWDFDNSDYIREKLNSNHQIHRTHCEASQRLADQQYKEFFNDKVLGSITLSDMKKFRDWLINSGLSPSRVNNILRAGITALKYAFYNGLTFNNCFKGMVFCGKQNQKKKNILTIEEAREVFNFEWKDYQAKLANKLSYYTGMRMGEIRALRLCDIGTDRIYVNNSYNKREGLKCCKNGEKREVFIPEDIRQELIKYGMKNPFGLGDEGYIFFGLKPNVPIDGKIWLREFNEVKNILGIERENITFHSWRHMFITIMSNTVPAKKLQQVTGHKTEEMIELYSDHHQENVFKELSEEVMKQMKL